MSLYETENDALNASGKIYRHYKGGIYRILYENVIHTETKEPMVVYEHLWPYEYKVYVRPQELFHGLNSRAEQRFIRVWVI